MKWTYNRSYTSTLKADIHAEYVSRIFYRIWISYVVKYSVSCLLWNILLHRIFIFYRIFLKHILHVYPPLVAKYIHSFIRVELAHGGRWWNICPQSGLNRLHSAGHNSIVVKVPVDAASLIIWTITRDVYSFMLCGSFLVWCCEVY